MTKPILLFKLKQAANYKTKKCNKSNCKVFTWITWKPPAFSKTYECYENTYLRSKWNKSQTIETDFEVSLCTSLLSNTVKEKTKKQKQPIVTRNKLAFSWHVQATMHQERKSGVNSKKELRQKPLEDCYSLPCFYHSISLLCPATQGHLTTPRDQKLHHLHYSTSLLKPVAFSEKDSWLKSIWLKDRDSKHALFTQDNPRLLRTQ